MKIGLIVAATPSPIAANGNGERLWPALADRLTDRGHDCELVVKDFSDASFREVLESYRRFRSLDVSSYDLVITGSCPSWMVQHDNHVLYLTHRLRNLYDNYPNGLGSLDNTARGRDIQRQLEPQVGDPEALLAATLEVLNNLALHDPIAAYPGPLARWVIHSLDDRAFTHPTVQLLASGSETAAGRVGFVPVDRSVMVARPEPSLPVSVASPSARTRFFAPHRHRSPDRLELVLSSFRAFEDPAATLRISNTGPIDAALRASVATDPRVELLGAIDEQQLADELASATAVVLAPVDDDACDIPIDAMSKGTPTITAADSGAASELIEHGVNGMIVEPTPDRLSWAMRHVANDPRVRWELALNSQRAAATVDWTAFLDEVDSLAEPVERPRVLVLSTYPVEPMVGGGQRRVRQLLRSLARWADVTLLTNTALTTTARRRRIEPGIDQIEIPKSSAQVRAEEDLYYALDRVPVDDVIAARIAAATPAFGLELTAQLADADAVVCAQPFLAPLLAETQIPVVHDSQNVESQLKSQLFADRGDLGRWLTAQATDVETEATQRSDLVVACTAADLQELLAAADHPETSTMVVDNGVDTESLPLRDREHVAPARAEVLAAIGRPDTEDRPLGLFIGSWHPPNVEAARLVFGVAKLRPDWIFVLAGSHTSEFAGEEVPSNVSLIAVFAESLLWPLMAASDVALNPMVSGGGSNLKVYDYLSVGVPVLTTDIGARGLGDNDDVVARVAATPEALAAGLDEARAMDNETLRRGRATVEKRFDWSVLGERWARAVLGLTGSTLPKERPVTRRPNRPMLTTTTPPPSDRVEATMELLGAAAQAGELSPAVAGMDPTIREHLKFASEHRFVGQQLPERTRMKAAKQLLVRVGKALSNEQVHYNEALLDATESMATQLHDNQAEIRRLRAELAILRAQHDNQATRS